MPFDEFSASSSLGLTPPSEGDGRTTQVYAKILQDSTPLRASQSYVKVLVEGTAVGIGQAYAKVLLLPEVPPPPPLPEAVAFPDLPGFRGASEMALALEEGEGGLSFGSFRVEPLGGGAFKLLVNVGRDPSGLVCEIGGASCLDAGEGGLVLRDLNLRYAATNALGRIDAHGCLFELGRTGFGGGGSRPFRAFGSVARWNVEANARNADLFDCHLYGTRGHNARVSGRAMDVTRCSAWNAGRIGIYGTPSHASGDRRAALRVRSSRIWGCEGGTLLYDPPGMRGEITGCVLDAPEAVAGDALDTYVVTSGNTVQAAGLFTPPPAPAWAPYP